jgi:hypothetical protein
MITPTSSSLRMGDCVPRASIAQRSWGCYTTHFSVWSMAWIGVRLAWRYPLTPLSRGWGPLSAANPTPALRWWHTSPSPPCAWTASPLQQHCLSRFSRFGIRRTPYGSSAMRACPTSRALTSTLGWLRWPGTRSNCSTSSTTPLGWACSRVCIWQHTRRAPQHENAILRSGTHPPSEQDRKLQDAYCHLSDTE